MPRGVELLDRNIERVIVAAACRLRAARTTAGRTQADHELVLLPHDFGQRKHRARTGAFAAGADR